MCQKFHKLLVKHLHVTIIDHELDWVNIDQNLTWKSHTDTVYKTVSKVQTN